MYVTPSETLVLFFLGSRFLCITVILVIDVASAAVFAVVFAVVIGYGPEAVPDLQDLARRRLLLHRQSAGAGGGGGPAGR